MDYSNSQISVIVAAAGTGTRMKSDVPKQMLRIDGYSILQLTVLRFKAYPMVKELIVVVSENILQQCKEDLSSLDLPFELKFVLGGEKRQDSVQNALDVLDSHCHVVAVHDGARPFFAAHVFTDALASLDEYHGAIAAVPATYTMKEVTGNVVQRTIPRETLWQVNTPQLFRKNALMFSYEKAAKEKFYGTDDAMLLEKYFYTITVIRDSEDNIKITTPVDMAVAQRIYRENKELFQ